MGVEPVSMRFTAYLVTQMLQCYKIYIYLIYKL
jgi:hypothetical protein